MNKEFNLYNCRGIVLKTKERLILILLVFVLCAAIAPPALAAPSSGDCGKKLTWSLNRNTGVLTVKALALWAIIRTGRLPVGSSP